MSISRQHYDTFTIAINFVQKYSYFRVRTRVCTDLNMDKL